MGTNGGKGGGVAKRRVHLILDELSRAFTECTLVQSCLTNIQELALDAASTCTCSSGSIPEMGLSRGEKQQTLGQRDAAWQAWLKSAQDPPQAEEEEQGCVDDDDLESSGYPFTDETSPYPSKALTQRTESEVSSLSRKPEKWSPTSSQSRSTTPIPHRKKKESTSGPSRTLRKGTHTGSDESSENSTLPALSKTTRKRSSQPSTSPPVSWSAEQTTMETSSSSKQGYLETSRAGRSRKTVQKTPGAGDAAGSSPPSNPSWSGPTEGRASSQTSSQRTQLSGSKANSRKQPQDTAASKTARTSTKKRRESSRGTRDSSSGSKPD